MQYGTSGVRGGEGVSLPLTSQYSAEFVAGWLVNQSNEGSVKGAKTTHLFHVVLRVEKGSVFLYQNYWVHEMFYTQNLSHIYRVI